MQHYVLTTSVTSPYVFIWECVRVVNLLIT